MEFINRKISHTCGLFLTVSLLSTAAVASRPVHNVDFLRKLANPTEYRVNKNYTESICGTNELQHVEEYDGRRGQPVEFVARYEQSVAALAEGTPEKSRKYCSGMMISENLFLTASHCIDVDTVKDYVVFNYQKKRGSTELQAEEHVKIEAVVEQTRGGLDFAILKLEGTPGLKYGFNPPNINTVELRHVLTIIQHPRGQPKQVDVGNRTGTRGVVYMTYNNLDTDPGSSGSAILNETGEIVGVHTNGGCNRFGGDNAGVMMTEIVKHSPMIQSLVGGKPQPPAPAPVDPVQPEPPTPAPTDPVQPEPPSAPSEPPANPAEPPVVGDPGFIDPGLNI